MDFIVLFIPFSFQVTFCIIKCLELVHRVNIIIYIYIIKKLQLADFGWKLHLVFTTDSNDGLCKPILQVCYFTQNMTTVCDYCKFNQFSITPLKTHSLTFIKQLQPWSLSSMVVADGIYISVDADTALECYNLYRCVPC